MNNVKDNDESRYLLDLKLLSSLKPIKGKVINLENKSNHIELNGNINNLNKDKTINLENNMLNTNLFFPTKFDFTLNNVYNYNNDIQSRLMTNISIQNINNMFSNNNFFFQDPFYLADNITYENNYRNLLSLVQMKSKEGFNLLNNNNNYNNTKISDSFLSNKNYLLNNNININNNDIKDENIRNKLLNIDLNYFQKNVNNNYINNFNLYNFNNDFNNNFFNNYNIININSNIYNNIDFNNFNNNIYKTVNNNNFINNINNIIHENNINRNEFGNFLNKKRKTTENAKKNKKLFSTNKIIKFKTNKNDKENEIEKKKITRPIIIFKCYQNKPKGINKKQKIKKKKFNLTCSHPNCQYICKTLKQLQNHHHKMIPDCQNDLISLLKLIYNTKLILIKNISNNINKRKYFSEVYEMSIKNISFNQYTQTISGSYLEKIDL